MRIYKENNRGRVASVWTVAISDQHGNRRKFAGFPDKATTQELGRKLEKLVAARISGRGLDAELTAWLEHVPDSLTKRLVYLGVLEAASAEAVRPLLITEKGKRCGGAKTVRIIGGHLFAYQRYMQGKEFTTGHIQTVISYCANLIESRGFLYPTDISTSGIETTLAEKRRSGASARTANAVLAAIKSFCNWLVREGCLASNPAARIGKMNIKADRRRPRRALTIDEVESLLAVTETGQRHHRLSGYERALVYRLALSTGLRYNEIRTLSVSDFTLDGDLPGVCVRAENEKAGRGERLPLQQTLASNLSACFKQSSDLLFGSRRAAFPGLWKQHGVKMLRQDLEAAGIDWRPDGKGEVLDFHSLRHTFGTMLAQSGVHPKVAQELMRHSSIDLTMNLYTHTVLADRAKATSALPDFCSQQGQVIKHMQSQTQDQAGVA